MITDTQVGTLRQIQSGVSVLIRGDLDGFFGSLNLNRPEAVRDGLLQFLPLLVRRYGQGAASVAADWYDEVRAGVNVRARFRAQVANPVDAERVEKMVRFAARHLFTETPELMLPAIDGAIGRYAVEPARMTIVDSARQDPAARGWARRARPDACDFCQMLAGRRAAYRGRDTAHFDAHDDCSCVAIPSWDL